MLDERNFKVRQLMGDIEQVRGGGSSSNKAHDNVRPSETVGR